VKEEILGVLSATLPLQDYGRCFYQRWVVFLAFRSSAKGEIVFANRWRSNNPITSGLSAVPKQREQFVT
jgi:hypothetical protein